MGLTGSPTSSIREGEGPDILISQVAFVDVWFASLGVYRPNKVLKWFQSKQLALEHVGMNTVG